MTIEEMGVCIKEFKLYLEMDIPLDDGNAVIDKLAKITSYMPTINQVSCEAENLVSTAMFRAVQANKDGSLKDLEKRKIYDYETRKERYTQAMADGLLNSAKYMIETLRTIISYRKTEIEKL